MVSNNKLPAPARALLNSLNQFVQRRQQTALPAHLCETRTLVVALSGGLDSMVLLDVCDRFREHWLPMFPGGLRAVHVHHGLSAHADSWVAFCREACDSRGIGLQVHHAGERVQALRNAGTGVEAAARDARYEAFAVCLAADELLLMAHHQDDQAETVLLNLLRGSGARGLSGMPVQRGLGQGELLRPFLSEDTAVSRAQLETYARTHALAHIDDDSNDDIRLSRNFLRHQVMPVLREHWPALNESLTRVAQLQAEQETILHDVACEYLRVHADDEEGSVSVAALRLTSPAMQRLVLRHWLHQRTGLWPDWQCVQTLREDFLLAATDAEPLLQWQGRELRRFRDRLYLMWPREAHVPAPSGGFVWEQAADGRLPALVLPGNGILRLIQVAQGGMCLPEAPTSVSYRQYVSDHAGQHNLLDGSFDCALAGRPHRALKKILQESDVPPWLRSRTPLVFVGGQLAWIAGVGVCEGFQQQPGHKGWAVNWQLPEAQEPE